MPKGDNKAVLNLTTELKVFMDKRKGDLERSFHLALAYLKQYEKDFIAEYGQESYDEHVKRYSRTAIQLRNDSRDRKLREKEELEKRLASKEKELALKEKELSLKEQTAQSFAVQTEVAKEKLELRKPQSEPEPKIPEPEDPKLKEFFESWKDRLEITETSEEYVLRFRENYGNALLTEILPTIKGFSGHYVSEGKNSRFLIPKVVEVKASC